MTWLDQIGGAIAPILAAVLGYGGARLIRKSNKEANSTESWKELFAGHQQWTRDQLSEQDQWTKERLAERDTKIAALEKDVHQLQTRFEALDEKYRAALAYIRTLWNLLTVTISYDDIPAAPDKIHPDL